MKKSIKTRGTKMRSLLLIAIIVVVVALVLVSNRQVHRGQDKPREQFNNMKRDGCFDDNLNFRATDLCCEKYLDKGREPI
ncbi:MAG: hypothetical protein NUV65_00790 [Candidatus Roizmanbacteria bacterium]|nr:hypothetical protein [Candidatus Roizmanbacteria bacterium]